MRNVNFVTVGYLVSVAEATVESRSSDCPDEIHAVPYERWGIEEFVIGWNGDWQTGRVELRGI